MTQPIFFDATPEQTEFQKQVLIDLMAIDMMEAGVSLRSRKQCRSVLETRRWKPKAIDFHLREAMRIARAFAPMSVAA